MKQQDEKAYLKAAKQYVALMGSCLEKDDVPHSLKMRIADHIMSDAIPTLRCVGVGMNCWSVVNNILFVL